MVQVVAILLAVVCCLGTEKCVQLAGKGKGCFAQTLHIQKKGMHKLMKSATLHGYGCYVKDTENLHQ